MSNAAVTIASERRTADDSRLDGGAAAFGDVRGRLMGIAYRILGSWSEAEDVVQDAWLRWQCCDRMTVVNPTTPGEVRRLESTDLSPISGRRAPCVSDGCAADEPRVRRGVARLL